MNNKFLLIGALSLLAGPAAAERIQSTTGVHLTFRQCVPGETACDSISRVKTAKYAGLPGGADAQASQQDPEYGMSTGSTKLTGKPGTAKMSASISSSQGARNGSNGFLLERYTNTKAQTETLTFSGTLTYDQTVPLANAVFKADTGTHSSASAEMEIFTLNVDSIEAGTTAMDNNAILQGDPEPGIEYASLKDARIVGHENVTGTGTKAFSETVVIEPGESIWLFAILQSLGSNGAVVNASLDTSTTINIHTE